MSAALGLHQCIERTNFLAKPTDKINEFLYKHRTLYKVVLIANHLFRAAAMLAFMLFLPFVPLANLAICLGGSLFYRLTVENNCAYKFALPAFAGATAALLAKTAWIPIITGVALSSIGAWALALASLVPITAYIVYIALTVSYDVDNK